MMNKEKTIKIEAISDVGFHFEFYIEKAVAGGTEEEMSVEGVASTTNIDHDQERMSEDALKAMAVTINTQSVPLRIEHQKDDNAIVGTVNKAWVDERNQLHIKAVLDKSHPGAKMLYSALKTGAKLGLSVGGRVKHAVKEFSEAVGKIVKTFYDVNLEEVSVTYRPSNFDSWLVQKSIKHKLSTGETLVESPSYNGFLFENQDFDFMQSFAKSIPEDAWKKTEINNNLDKNMSKMEDMKVKKATDETSDGPEKKEEKSVVDKKDETEKETEKSVTPKEFEAFKSIVTKGFEGLTKLLTKKTETETAEKEGEETTIMEDKKKAQAKEEGEKKDGETDDTKEKAVNSNTEEDETKEKAADKTKDETVETKDYHINAMKNILKTIDGLAKAMDANESETKEKAESDKEEEDEKTEKSQKSELDEFVDVVEKSVNDLKDRIEKGGKRAPGLAEMIVNIIRTDTGIQNEIKGMINQPGFKKSMSMGVPMMRTKDGKAYRLTAQPLEEEVKKSADSMKGKSFKDVYNTVASSSASTAREE